MLVEILIAITMNLSMYIITSNIVNQGNEQTKNYFRDQLDSLRQTIINTGTQQQGNMLSEIKQIKTDVIAEVKESSEKVVK